jgi:sugar lactone lactonase YvrE
MSDSVIKFRAETRTSSELLQRIGANVYVADSQAGLFYKVTPDGTQATVGSGFYMPMSVAVDKAGNVYAADPWNGFVAKITPDGAQTTLGGGYNSPVGVAVDRAGNVYVADTYNSAVFKIAPDGTQTTLGAGLVAPQYVAVDRSGDLYVTDTGTNSLVFVRGWTCRFQSWGCTNSNVTISPHSIHRECARPMTE